MLRHTIAYPLLALPIGTNEDTELKDAMRLSFGLKRGPVMILGGSDDVDPQYRSALSGCGVFTVGNHESADVRGDWADGWVWEEVRKRNPSVIVIDIGSDSWITRSAVDRLATFVNETECVLMFSPPPFPEIPNSEGDSWITLMQSISYLSNPDMQRRYQVTLLEDGHLFYTYWGKLDESPMFASEIEMLAKECKALLLTDAGLPAHSFTTPPHPSSELGKIYKKNQDMLIEQRKDCFAKLSALGNPVSFMTALKQQMSFFLKCVEGED